MIHQGGGAVVAAELELWAPVVPPEVLPVYLPQAPGQVGHLVWGLVLAVVVG